MDFLDPKKKRAHRIRLWIGYLLLVAFVAIGTLVFVYETYGYGVDKNGEIIQNGLVFIDAQPKEAQIFINGQDQHTTTSLRKVMPVGDYSLELRRDGYRTWTQSFKLEASKIERFVYPLLIPNELTTKQLAPYAASPLLYSQSPDRKWLVVGRASSENTANDPLKLDVFNLQKIEETKLAVSIPKNLLKEPNLPTTGIEEVEWSTDNKHVLLKRFYTGGSEYIIFNREAPEKTLSLSASLQINPDKVTLFDKKIDRIYSYTQQTGLLQLIEVQSRKTTKIASNVVQFKPFEDGTVLYATSENAPQGRVKVVLRTDGKNFNLQDIAVGSRYFLDTARFDGEWYVVAAVDTDERVLIYRNPTQNIEANSKDVAKPFMALKLSGTEKLSFSANTRFVAAQAGSHIVVHDFEADRNSSFTFPEAITSAETRWMDGHRFLTRVGGKAVIVDFNGTNKQVLVTSKLPQVGYFDRDYTRFFTLDSGATEPSVKLQYTELRSQADLPNNLKAAAANN